MKDADPVAERERKAQRLRRFLGPLAANDAATVDHWRAASPAQHAAAMIELCACAEQMAAHTGLTKDPSEIFPSIAALRVRTAGNRRD